MDHELKEILTVIVTKIDSLEGKFEYRFDRLEGRMDKLENRMDSLEGRMDGLEGRMDKLENRMDGLEGRMDKLENRMDGLEGRMDGLEGRMDKLENRMDSVENEVFRLGTIENDLKQTRLTIENEITTGIRRVAEGHLDLARNLHEAMKPQTEVEMLAIRVNRLDTQMRDVKETLSQLQATAL
ncbi:MAG TPA: hypothetical protein H9761_02810 [Candidatus Eisenbergiella merdavium]|uniref:t-SNARE coiled-coil homology domain-containing protein n=1 Tax=Candidatus Eisenbergiella merdavium TaxID=2838551 RepID=A0A9D2SPX8_9FIRM|nr:hypothetical protein [Candidatus Eisenbergiella merdavium]